MTYISGVFVRRQVGHGSWRPWAVFLTLLLLSVVSANAQSEKDQDKSLDVKSSVGDLHVGNDADIRETGLPAYPGARLRKHDDDRNSANLALFTSAFGVKLIVLNYDSGDAPDKIIAFYRGKLKKFGKVLECHTSKHSGDFGAHLDSDDSDQSKPLTCDGDNSGNIVELKVGTEDNQHLVAVEPAESGSGSTFAVVYIHTRGKQGDI
jgi:hypothetical protein